jgi:hypothetical protein
MSASYDALTGRPTFYGVTVVPPGTFDDAEEYNFSLQEGVNNDIPIRDYVSFRVNPTVIDKGEIVRFTNSDGLVCEMYPAYSYKNNSVYKKYLDKSKYYKTYGCWCNSTGKIPGGWGMIEGVDYFIVKAGENRDEKVPAVWK